MLDDAAIALGADCASCPLGGCGRGPVFSSPSARPKFHLIGEAPGKHEVQKGRPFVGPSGAELDQALESVGTERDEVYISNVLLCQPPEDLDEYLERLSRLNKKNGTTTPSPIACCAPRLAREIQEVDADVILAVGGKALQAVCAYFGIPYGRGEDSETFIKAASIMQQHGAPIVIPKGHLTPRGPLHKDIVLRAALHPAFGLRDHREYLPVIQQDIARAVVPGRIVQFDLCPSVLYVAPPPGYPELPESECRAGLPEGEKLNDILRELEALRALGRPISCDIETDSKYPWAANIRCIGLGARVGHGHGPSDHRVVMVPIQYRSGKAYWSPEAAAKLKAYLQEYLDAVTLVGHNFIAYDTQVLLNRGYMTNRRKSDLDTMVMAHNTIEGDLPVGLSAVARRHLDIRMWKADADAKDSNGVKTDYALHAYCVYDVWTVLLLAPKLSRMVSAAGNKKANTIDHRCAPSARDAGAAGVWVNERVREEFSRRLHKTKLGLLASFRQFSGQNLNPNSPQQIKAWLFDELGVLPVMNTKGKEFKEGDAPTVGIPAVLEIIKRGGLDKDTEKALDAYIQYKACAKLISSYTDNTETRDLGDFTLGYLGPYYGIPEDPETSVRLRKSEPIMGRRPLLSNMPFGFNLARTPTGRWSSSPNIQTFPSRAFGGLNLKEMVQCPPGFLIVGADLEQVEARIHAVVAGDQVILDAIAQGKDIHAMNAAPLFAGPGATLSDIESMYAQIVSWKKSPDQKLQKKAKNARNVAKAVHFAKVYGCTADKLYEILSTSRDKSTMKRNFPENMITPERCKEWDGAWNKQHPETAILHASIDKQVRFDKHIHSLLHDRKRWAPRGFSKFNAPRNHIIQASAAAIKNKAWLEITDVCDSGYLGIEARPYLECHDYIGILCREEYAERAVRVINEKFRWEYGGVEFPPDTPLATWDLAAQG